MSVFSGAPLCPELIRLCGLFLLLQGTSVSLPEGAIRYVINLEGDESDADLAKLSSLSPLFLLLTVKPELSRVHAARRVFEHLVETKSTLPVIHHAVFGSVDKDELILRSGAEVSSSAGEFFTAWCLPPS